MSFPEYKKGIIDCKGPVDASSLKDKSVVVTGGAKGMGEEAVSAFHKAGAFVTFGDRDSEPGKKLAEELGSKIQFCVCDVTFWDEQLAMFKAAKAKSRRQSIDVVVANAGISGPHVLFDIEDSDEPKNPTLNILHINLIGVMYSMKIARHYFVKQPADDEHDRCFIMNASLVGYLDVPGTPQYMSSKYVATNILNPKVVEFCKSKGIIFADAADCAAAMIKIASDKSINGRAFAILPRDDEAPNGYRDVGKDDYDGREWLDDRQDILLRTSHRLQVKAEEQ